MEYGISREAAGALIAIREIMAAFSSFEEGGSPYTAEDVLNKIRRSLAQCGFSIREGRFNPDLIKNDREGT